MSPSVHFVPVLFFVLLVTAACGGGEWAGEGAEGLEQGGWPENLAGAWVQEIPGCPGSERRWDFFPPDTFVESVSDATACVEETGEWHGGMTAGAGGLLDLTCEGPEPFRRTLAAVLDGALNTRAFADEGEGRCFFRHEWHTRLAEIFFDRRLGLRLCFDRALGEREAPVAVEMRLWLDEDVGTDAMAAVGEWSWTLALQAGRAADGALLLWPEDMSRERMTEDWVDFLRREMSDGGRLALMAGQEMRPLWRWDAERLVEDAPGAWMHKL